MQPNPLFWSRQRVCVTGGTGFLGWHLVQQLAPLGARVRVFGLPPASANLGAQLRDVECVFGDIRDAAAVRHAVRDCDVVFHTAGTVGVWGPALLQMHGIHVEGTRQVLAAVPEQARLVHTSSVVAVGASHGDVLNEDSPFGLQHLRVDYIHAKKAAEDVALTAAAGGRNVVVVNPAYLIGPDDFEGSVMGRLCVRFWRGKMPMIPPGGLNFVDVRDVALGHLLAAERGVAGRRYILGGENLSMMDFVRRLATVRGQSMRWRFSMPRWLQAAIACYAELRSHLLKREPYPSFQHVRVSRYLWYYSSARAQTEFGYLARPMRATIEDTHEWYCGRGQLHRPRELPLAA